MDLPKIADVVIIGGGVMGASTAYHLAKCGVKNVVILEKESFLGQGATGRCAGGVRYQFATEVNIQLSQKSLPLIKNLKEETGQTGDYNPCGYLIALTDEKDIANFKRNISLQHSLGVQTQWLEGDEIRKRLPLMNLEDVICGTFHDKDGIADPNSVVMAYVSAANRLGVKILTDNPVTQIHTKNNRVVGIETPNGSISAPIIVNSAGPWAGLIGEMVGLKIPITPLRRQMLTTTALPEIPADFPFVIDFAQSLYFHREGQGLLTGMSNPKEKPGFDQRVDLEFELVNLEAAIARMPLLEKAGLASHWAGLYEVTPDAHPIFGKTPVDGFYIVGGFSGHGFMHGPVSGILMAEIITEGKAGTVDVSMLDYWRFEENRLIHEYNVI